MDTSNWYPGNQTGGQPVQPMGQTGQNMAVTGGYTHPQQPIAPFPADYPFEEPEQAPELRSQRSENLYSRSEPFWDKVIEIPADGEEYPRDPNYWNHPEELAEDKILSVTPAPRRSVIKGLLGSHAVRMTLLIAGVLLVVAIIVCSAVFRVRSITVTGTDLLREEDLIRYSGIEMGDNTIFIDEAAVEERMKHAEPYLRYVFVNAGWNSVTIDVREREPVAALRNRGMLMVTDNRGWVLAESQDTSDPAYAHLISVNGLDVQYYVPGAQLMMRNTTQLPVFTEILIELKAMNALDLIEELDLSGMDSINLVTKEGKHEDGTDKDGFDVRLGSAVMIHQKLRAMLITREKLLEMGVEGGGIDVSDPTKPKYSPPDL